MHKIIHTNRQKIKERLFSRTFLPIIILSLAIFTPASPTSALSSSNTTNIQFTFSSALSISVSGDLLINDLAPGTASDSNTITIDVGTNNITGYNLYATVGNDTIYNNTYLNHTTVTPSNNTNSNEPVDGRFTSLTTTDNISELSNLDPNTWGYSYATTNTTNNNTNTTAWNWNNYSGLPIYSDTAKTLATTTTASSNTIAFKIAAKAASSQTAGSYSNVINFTAVTNKAPVSFYDAYKSAGKEMYNGYYTMQDMSSSICEAIEVYGDDSATDLVDIRDNEVYKIAKLLDDKCWLLDNLRLDLSKALPEYTGSGKITLTDANTNAATQAISCLTTGKYNGSTCTSPYSSKAVEARTLNGGSWGNVYEKPYMATSGNCINTSNCTNGPGDRQWSKDDFITTEQGIGSGKIGIYYNFCTASAGSYCYQYDAGADITNTAIDTPSDICPSNWRIPTGGPYNAIIFGGDYQNLYNKYSGAAGGQAAAFVAALSVPLSGYFYSDSADRQGTLGYFWSSTYYGGNNMYLLYAYSSSAIPQYVSYRTYGFSVRCLIK